MSSNMIDAAQMTVLIVDDMENMCKSIRGMLRVLGCGKKFHFTFNGHEALTLLKKEPIDLAIVDWNMPVMTGVELLNRIREDRNKGYAGGDGHCRGQSRDSCGSRRVRYRCLYPQALDSQSLGDTDLKSCRSDKQPSSDVLSFEKGKGF